MQTYSYPYYLSPLAGLLSSLAKQTKPFQAACSPSLPSSSKQAIVLMFEVTLDVLGFLPEDLSLLLLLKVIPLVADLESLWLVSAMEGAGPGFA